MCDYLAYYIFLLFDSLDYFLGIYKNSDYILIALFKYLRDL